MNRGLLLLLGLALAVAARGGVIVAPTSYDMRNGDTGSYDYHDDTYSGTGDVSVDSSPLAGGLGDLTDGIIATDNWYVVEAPAGAGPYVGWADSDPTITFRFAGAQVFERLNIHFDDADGAGGVSTPSGVTINGTLHALADPAGDDPFWASFSLLGEVTDTLVIELHRNDIWVFASEFTFERVRGAVPPIPEPATLAVLLPGLLALRRRRR